MRDLLKKTSSRPPAGPGRAAVAVDLYPDPAVVTGPGWVIREANRLFEVLVGCGPGALAGRRFYGLCAETPFLPPHPAAHGRARRTAGVEVKIIRDGGGTVPVSLSISVFNDNPEHPGGAVVTARDMTDKAGLAGRLERTVEELERRNSYIDDFRSGVLHMIRDLDRSERELEETCARLRETQAQLVQSSKLTALGELSAGLAHELNQPLTVIKGLVGKILKERAEGPGGDDTDKLRLIAGASSRMEEIANHLRVFARSEAGHLESVDLNRVIRDAFLMMGEYFHKHSIEVELDLGLVARIKGSPTRLEQVVINLATNARDAMPGGGTLTVRTRTVSAGGETRVEAVVADTGKGMDREAAGRIFTPFFTTKPAGKGTGLGLSISRNIVKEHGGDISVESEPGHGTAFTLTFPAAPAEDPG